MMRMVAPSLCLFIYFLSWPAARRLARQLYTCLSLTASAITADVEAGKTGRLRASLTGKAEEEDRRKEGRRGRL